MPIPAPSLDDLSRDPEEDARRFSAYTHTAPGFRSAHEVGLAWVRRAVEAEYNLDQCRVFIDGTASRSIELREENEALKAKVAEMEKEISGYRTSVGGLELEVQRLTKLLVEKSVAALPKPKPIAEAS